MESEITAAIRSDRPLSLKGKLGLVRRLSVPAILSRLTMILMQYIDAAMVGKLGADASASIGIVASTTWLLDGLLYAVITGIAIQLAQKTGAGKSDETRNLFAQGSVISVAAGFVIAFAALLIGPYLPIWLGADDSIRESAATYFIIYEVFAPIDALNYHAGQSLQATGSMKLPAVLFSTMSLLDIIFNFFLIYPGGEHTVFGVTFSCPGAGLGVAGAALGTCLAWSVSAVILYCYAAFRYETLKIKRDTVIRISRNTMLLTARLSVPLAFTQMVTSGAMIMTTHIAAPLGNVAIAANSLAVTAESFCYMPAYGMASAATTAVGQSVGASKSKLAKNFAWTIIFFGMALMLILGTIMFFICPKVFSFLTSDAAVASLGVTVLRYELFAEPFYGASIIAEGALRGAGDTVAASLMSLLSLWAVRIPLSYLLIAGYGLVGIWVAMEIELTFRGIVFMLRIAFVKWKSIDEQNSNN